MDLNNLDGVITELDYPDSPALVEAKIIRNYLESELELINLRIEKLKKENTDRYTPRSGDNEAPTREEIIRNTAQPPKDFHEIVMESKTKETNKKQKKRNKWLKSAMYGNIPIDKLHGLEPEARKRLKKIKKRK
jgi:hypothetical protein